VCISEVLVYFLEFAVLIVELVYFFDHSELVVALQVEVGFDFLVLILQAVIQDFDFVLVVPLEFIELDGSGPLVELILVGQLLKQGFVGPLHLLFLAQDVLEVFNQTANFSAVVSPGVG